MVLSSQQLKIAKWYWTHKKKLYYFFVGFLVLLDIALLGVFFSLQNRHINSDTFWQISASLAVERIDYPFFHKLLGPKDLIITGEQSIPSKGNYDFLCLIENPNPNWQVKNIRYSFQYRGGESPVNSTFILPNSEKYLYITARQLENVGIQIFHRPRGVKLSIKDISWQRIRKHEDFAIISNNPLKSLKFTDLHFEKIIQNNQKVSRISFQVENPTVYSFWEVPLVIVPYRGSLPIALGILPVRYLKTQEKRLLEYLWPYILPSANRVDIRPDLNILDPSIFMPPE